MRMSVLLWWTDEALCVSYMSDYKNSVIVCQALEEDVYNSIVYIINS